MIKICSVFPVTIKPESGSTGTLKFKFVGNRMCVSTGGPNHTVFSLSLGCQVEQVLIVA